MELEEAPAQLLLVEAGRHDAVAPERPRLTLALAVVGRWRDAARSLAGLRWIPVAAAVLLLNRTTWRVLAWPVDALGGGLFFDPWVILSVFAPLAVLKYRSVSAR